MNDGVEDEVALEEGEEEEEVGKDSRESRDALVALFETPVSEDNAIGRTILTGVLAILGP